MLDLYITNNEYLSELAKYNFNALWRPSLGHYAIKRLGGDYYTTTSEIVSLNKYDLIFINVNRLRSEYFWIPTVQDLLELLHREKNPDEVGTFKDFIVNCSTKIISEALKRGAKTLELCLIAELEDKGIVLLEQSSSFQTFSHCGKEPDLEILSNKEKFLKEFA